MLPTALFNQRLHFRAEKQECVLFRQGRGPNISPRMRHHTCTAFDCALHSWCLPFCRSTYCCFQCTWYAMLSLLFPLTSFLIQLPPQSPSPSPLPPRARIHSHREGRRLCWFVGGRHTRGDGGDINNTRNCSKQEGKKKDKKNHSKHPRAST